RFRCEGARIEPELTHGPSGQKRLPTPGPERRIGPDCCALPSPRLRGRSRSRRPSELADRFDAAKARPSPAGRGRNVRRAAKNPARLMVHNGFDCCSLSHQESWRFSRIIITPDILAKMSLITSAATSDSLLEQTPTGIFHALNAAGSNFRKALRLRPDAVHIFAAQSKLESCGLCVCNCCI